MTKKKQLTKMILSGILLGTLTCFALPQTAHANIVKITADPVADQVADSDFTITGTGTPIDPYIYSQSGDNRTYQAIEDKSATGGAASTSIAWITNGNSVKFTGTPDETDPSWTATSLTKAGQVNDSNTTFLEASATSRGLAVKVGTFEVAGKLTIDSTAIASQATNAGTGSSFSNSFISGIYADKLGKIIVAQDVQITTSAQAGIANTTSGLANAASYNYGVISYGNVDLDENININTNTTAGTALSSAGTAEANIISDGLRLWYLSSSGGVISVGKNATIDITATAGSADSTNNIANSNSSVSGITLNEISDHPGNITIGGKADITLTSIGGNALSSTDTATTVSRVSGIYVNQAASTVSIGDALDVNSTVTGGIATSTNTSASTDIFATGVFVDINGGAVTIADNVTFTNTTTGGKTTLSTGNGIASSKVEVEALKAYNGSIAIAGNITNEIITTGGKATAQDGFANSSINVFGAHNKDAGTITIGDDFIFKTTTTGGTSTSATANSDSQVKVNVIRTDVNTLTIGGNVDSTTTVTGGEAIAGSSADSRIDVRTIVGWLGGTIALAGDVTSKINATGGKAESTILGTANASMKVVTAEVSMNSKLTINGDFNSDITATGGEAISSGTVKAGVLAGGIIVAYNTLSNTVVTVDGNTNINVVANGGTANGADAEAYAFGVSAKTGVIDLKGDVVITASATTASGTAGIADALGAVNGTINVNQAGGKKVQLTGDVAVRSDQESIATTGKINAKFDTSDSFLKGLVDNAGTGTQSNLTFTNGASWIPTGNGPADDGQIFSNFGTAGTGLTLGNGGVLDMAAWNLNSAGVNANKAYRTLDISGNTNLEDGAVFRINTNVALGTSDQINFIDAPTSIAGTQYVQIGYDPTVAAQLDLGVTTLTPTTPIIIVTGVTGLTGVAGKESQIDGVLFRHTVNPTISDNGAGTLSLNSLSSLTSKKTLSEGPRTAIDAQQSGQNAWLNQGNHMVRRLGDLRLENDDAQNGIWARVYTGSNRVKASTYNRKFDQDYTGMQIGYDRKIKASNGHFYLGGLFDYQTSDSTYFRGSGEVDSYGLGLYGSWISDKGHHLDLVLRSAKINNDYSFQDINNNKFSGDYDLMSYGASLEYGYRKDLKKNFFVEPQAQLNLGYMENGNHTLSNGLDIHQDSIMTGTGRLGILLGKEFGKDAKKGNVYFQTSLIQDFSETPSMYASNKGQRVKIDSIDTKGTSFEFALGTNYKFNENGKLYIEISKTVNGEIDTRWQLNGGVRIKF